MKKMLQTMLCWFPGNQTTQNSDSTVAKLPNDPLNASSARIPTHLSFVRRLVLTCLIIFSTLILNAQTQTVILTSGSSWTVPSDVYSITVECWGGGGGGGAARNSGVTGNRRASGGGGGGYTSRTFIVTPGTTYSYTIGGGGSAGATSGGTGGTGGSSTFTVGGTTITASGGVGGPGTSGSGNGTAAAGGAGGTGTNGTINYSGGAGGSAGSNGAGGGGGAGTSSNGTDGTNTSGGAGGSGNPDGTGGSANTGGSDGDPGFLYGGGGSGAKSGALGNRPGGAGAQGFIRITYCVAPSNVTAGSAKTICTSGSTTLDGAATASTTIFSEDFERAPGFYYIYGAWTEYTITTGNGYNGWYYSNTSPISGSRYIIAL
jgi:hypothetical protein